MHLLARIEDISFSRVTRVNADFKMVRITSLQRIRTINSSLQGAFRSCLSPEFWHILLRLVALNDESKVVIGLAHHCRLLMRGKYLSTGGLCQNSAVVKLLSSHGRHHHTASVELLLPADHVPVIVYFFR